MAPHSAATADWPASPTPDSQETLGVNDDHVDGGADVDDDEKGGGGNGNVDRHVNESDLTLNGKDDDSADRNSGVNDVDEVGDKDDSDEGDA